MTAPAAPDEPATGRTTGLVALRIALYAVIALTVLCVAVRRLNFDESLALKAGWLLTNGVDAEPNFYMPFTVLLGSLANLVEDPGALLLALRIAGLMTVLAAVAWMVFQTRLGAGGKLLALLATLCHWTFVVHGFEFRYDWAILVGLCLALGLLMREGTWSFACLGLAIAWLAAHHLKGVYFGAVVYCAAVVRIGLWEGRRRQALAAVHGSLFFGLAAWAGLSAVSGHLSQLVGLYEEFFGVATTSQKVWPWTSMGSTLVRDAGWWAVAAAGLVACGFFLRRHGLRADLAVAAWFALAAVGFWFLHPHPWPYMAALPVPFLSILLADALVRWAGRRRWRWALTAAAYAGLQVWLGFPPGGAYLASLRAPMTEQVSTLRALREHALPGDRVIDPSGLAYFLPPSYPQWYLDTLFAERARQGLWMAGVEIDDTAGQWVVLSYRLQAFPKHLSWPIRSGFAPVGGGLAISRRDRRWSEQHLDLALEHRSLESFW